MRPDTKLKVARRKHTIEVLRWLYSRREPKLDGAALSLEHRKRQEGGVANSRPFTYGEVDVPDFLCILGIAKPREGEVFVDLGSGTGKAVLTAACGFPEFSKCRGIELVQGLADAANDHLRTMQAFLESSDADGDITHANGTIKSGFQQEVGTSATHPSVGGSDGEPRAGGEGWGGKKRGNRNKKRADQGLYAAQLEELIADMLTPSAPSSGSGTGRGAEGSGRATAEDIASRLVQELGHRRYKATLRGHGGLEMFLANLSSNQTSSRVDVAAHGDTVALKQTVELPRAAEDSVLHSCCEEVSNSDVPALLNAEGAESRSAALNTKLQGEGLVSSEAVSPQATGNHGSSLTSARRSTSTTTSSSASMLVVPFIPRDVSISVAARTPCPSSARSPPTKARDNAVCDHASDDVSAGSGGRGKRGEAGVGRRRLPEAGPLTCGILSRVELMCGDIFQEPWSHAGVVYVASLLFDDSMMAKLSDRVEELSKGARIISLRPIFPRSSRIENISSADEIDNGGVAPSTVILRLVHDGVFRMSWQMARVYIYVRV